MSEKLLTESIPKEEESYTDDALYNISSYGTDIMLSQLISMYNSGDIEKPGLQRNYVWSKKEASRFIDSILLGLPVPSIFLAKDNENKLLIVDGFQRIITICDYVNGIFSSDGSLFKLTNSELIYPKWKGKTYKELSDSEQRSIRTYSLHAIVFEQKQPKDDSGMYQIFERINTGGRVLRPQEIRNCIYQGPFNDLIEKLNKEKVWRKILGSEIFDSRMADIELILRFFAFIFLPNRTEYEQKQLNLVKYLNSFMDDNKLINEEGSKKFSNLFIKEMNYLYHALGSNAFRTAKKRNDNIVWAKKVNPVVFDAVCTATYLEFKNLPQGDLSNKYLNLVLDDEFSAVTRQRTTDLENIRRRVQIARNILYGLN